MHQSLYVRVRSYRNRSPIKKSLEAKRTWCNMNNFLMSLNEHVSHTMTSLTRRD